MLDSCKEVIVPSEYKPTLSIRDTGKAIKRIKDFFELELAKGLNLERVSAPLFVRPESGMNDNLSGVERPVAFNVKAIDENIVEIVHSLAKWKRMALKRYQFNVGEGLYTDMNAIRRDEDLGNLHSIYVDQWDWEIVINKEDRKIEILKETVEKIFNALKKTEDHICDKFPSVEKILPDEIFFITTQELEDMYPELSPDEREDKISEEKKVVFIMKIGGTLKSGIKHGERAPDYDDWDLNGDILLWYPLLNRAMEISSMGIRVDESALLRQLKKANCEDRKNLLFHKKLLDGKLPYTIGGGIGQSRMCMYMLKKAHIGEVQASVWPDSMIEACDKVNIKLL